MINEIAIIGYGGHGKVLREIASLNGYTPIFFDDNYEKINKKNDSDTVYNPDDLLRSRNEIKNIVVAIGDNRIRSEVYSKFKIENYNFPTLIHPKSIISDSCSLDQGSVVMAGAIINSSAKIGFGAIVNTKSVIEHDCILGNFVHISPGTILCGNVTIGDSTWIGAASVIKNEINIGEEVIIGAGSTVLSDVPDFVTAYGVPAKII